MCPCALMCPTLIIIFLCLIPDTFTHQGESEGESVTGLISHSNVFLGNSATSLWEVTLCINLADANSFAFTIPGDMSTVSLLALRLSFSEQFQIQYHFHSTNFIFLFIFPFFIQTNVSYTLSNS